MSESNSSSHFVDKTEMTVLRAEMKQCTNQVQKLTKEFSEMKKAIEAAQDEVDSARYVLTEVTIKLKEIL